LKALKLALGLRMSSPSNFVYMEAKEPTMEFRRRYNIYVEIG